MTIDTQTRRDRGIRLTHGHGGRLVVDVDAVYPDLIRIRDEGEDWRTGEERVTVEIRPAAELSGEIWITTSVHEMRQLRDAIDAHLSQTERRSDGRRPTTVR